MSIERRGRELLGKLALGISSAKSYLGPSGDVLRDETLVRWAMKELKNPNTRLLHELWFSQHNPLPQNNHNTEVVDDGCEQAFVWTKARKDLHL